jgi:hypothetical protein
MADASSTDELATTTTPHFECIGNFVLILGYQCGKQIVKVNHFSASRSRFQTCKENKCLARVEYKSNMLTIVPWIQALGFLQGVVVVNRCGC